jgi:hypothetical protein
LLSYVLAIPALPWCQSKELLRAALVDLVPEEVRLRPKTFLREDPVAPRLRREDLGWIDRFDACSELARFVDRQRLTRLAGETDAERFVVNTRPYSLNQWLRLLSTSHRRARSEPDCTASVFDGVGTFP